METPTQHVRVRFAPSPTGWMHLGNVRTALINALFAKKYNGTFVLRIEDTDANRLVDPGGKKIMEDLAWLHLQHDEGPDYQSQRHDLYQKYFALLQEKNMVYRCFETHEELEQKRMRQVALGLPPRYDRAALSLTPEQIEKNLSENKPFIWRFKLPETSIAINDIACGTITFDMSNFSDFALTRPDGSFTFIFANCVDDIDMRITHVIRGNDHLTNTADQAALYQAFGSPIPTFYHLPLICSLDGKKLSKRDFGASLEDLKQAGYLAEAICNYLGIIGSSFKEEIMTLDELAMALTFSTSSPSGHVRYDGEKLRWINHQWITRLSQEELTIRCRPFLEQKISAIRALSDQEIGALLTHIKTDLVTLADAPDLLIWLFEHPTIGADALTDLNAAAYKTVFASLVAEQKATGADTVSALKQLCQKENCAVKNALMLTRVALTGKSNGLAVAEIINMLGAEETQKRLALFVELL